MAYCVNGCWTVSNRIGVGTETPSTALHIVGAHTSGLGIINAISSDSSILNLDSSTADARVRLKYQGGERWFAGMSDTQFNYHIQNGNNGSINLAVSYATGNVGIGTCSPSHLLHVCGAPTSNGLVARFQSTATSGSISISHSGNGGNIGYANIGAGNAANVFYVTTGAGTIGSGIVMDNAGLVGIGTCSPGSLLTVTNCISTAYTPSNTLVSGQWFRVSNPNANSGVSTGILFESAGPTGGNGLATISGVNTATGSAALTFGTRDASSAVTERVRITSDGNVGIGTSSPGVKLQVYGSHVGGRGILELQSADDALVALRKSSGNSGMRFQDFNGTDRWFVGESNDCNIYFMDCFNTSKVRFAVTRPGNVGINTCTPETTLHMTADSPYVFIDDTSTASSRKRVKLVAGDVGVIQSFSVAFSCINNTCQVDAMFINENASVGINTSTPGAYKLNVNGAFYAAGSSIKYKHSICDYDTDSCIFMCLKPVTYQYKDEWQHLGREMKSQSQIGLIAEDVAQVMPELAILVNEEEEKVVRNVDYEKLSVVLLKEVQKLRREMDDLKHKEQ